MSEFMPSHLAVLVTLLAETFSAIIQQAVWTIPVMGLKHSITNGAMSIAKPEHDDSDCFLAHLYPDWSIHIIWPWPSSRISGQIAFNAGSIIFLIKVTNNILCLG